MSRPSFALPNSQIPTQGPVGIPVALDFTASDNVVGDLTTEQQNGVIDFVQAIWIDNRLNTKTLLITFSGLQQTLSIRAGRQGCYPVLPGPGRLSWNASSVGSGVLVSTIMFNVKLPYFSYDA